mmetsp:Transcript_86973/g.218903  ORF Transcript_86973/g.218903 Transcript_86973/m.218903 type:complete len:347 (+) Transcript_86973:67-1107(+)
MVSAFEGLSLQIASDLHLEMYDVPPSLEDILTPSAPVLALLGDISALGYMHGVKMYEHFLAECSRRFYMVLVLPGNHEFYNDGHSCRTQGDILEYMRNLSSAFPNVRLLENSGITVNGVRISGTALWSAVPEEAKRTVEFSMNDYNLIYVSDGGLRAGCQGMGGEVAKLDAGTSAASSILAGFLPIPSRSRSSNENSRFSRGPNSSGGGTSTAVRRLCVADSNALHEEAVRFLEREAEKATQKRVNLLVLTHHTPSFHGTSDPRHGVNPSGISSAFSTDLEHMLRNPRYAAIHTWCFGHTHFNSDQCLSGVRLVSNQTGYVQKPSMGYRRDLVIRVPKAYVERPSS